MLIQHIFSKLLLITKNYTQNDNVCSFQINLLLFTLLLSVSFIHFFVYSFHFSFNFFCKPKRLLCNNIKLYFIMNLLHIICYNIYTTQVNLAYKLISRFLA